MDKLYTTQQIAEMYSNITPSTITENWIPKGLKYIRGKRNSYLYKLKWVDEFIEQMANEKIEGVNNQLSKNRIKKCEYKIV